MFWPTNVFGFLSILLFSLPSHFFLSCLWSYIHHKLYLLLFRFRELSEILWPLQKRVVWNTEKEVSFSVCYYWLLLSPTLLLTLSVISKIKQPPPRPAKKKKIRSSFQGRRKLFLREHLIETLNLCSFGLCPGNWTVLYEVALWWASQCFISLKIAISHFHL